MAKIITDVNAFTAPAAWGSRDLAEIGGATARLHWTDKPYRWHVNTGSEVFVVLSGEVEMRYRRAGVENAVLLGVSDIFVAEDGDEHVAIPRGEARVLVVQEKHQDSRDK